jgi:hypothetical protein
VCRGAKGILPVKLGGAMKVPFLEGKSQTLIVK